MIRCRKTPTSKPKAKKPPRQYAEAETKCPLSLKADTRKPVKTEFFNTLGQDATS